MKHTTKTLIFICTCAASAYSLAFSGSRYEFDSQVENNRQLLLVSDEHHHIQASINLARYSEQAIDHFILTLRTAQTNQGVPGEQLSLLNSDVAVNSLGGANLSRQEMFMIRQFLARGLNANILKADTTTPTFIENNILGYGFNSTDFFKPYSIKLESMDAIAEASVTFRFLDNHGNHFESLAAHADFSVQLDKVLTFPYRSETNSNNPAQSFLSRYESLCSATESINDCFKRVLIDPSVHYYFGSKRRSRRQVESTALPMTAENEATTDSDLQSFSGNYILYPVLSVVGVFIVVDLIALAVTAYLCVGSVKRLLATSASPDGNEQLPTSAGDDRGDSGNTPARSNAETNLLPGSGSMVAAVAPAPMAPPRLEPRGQNRVNLANVDSQVYEVIELKQEVVTSENQAAPPPAVPCREREPDPANARPVDGFCDEVDQQQGPLYGVSR